MNDEKQTCGGHGPIEQGEAQNADPRTASAAGRDHAQESAEALAKATARFWRFVDKRGPDECWEWKGARNMQPGKGYGKFHAFGRFVWAHRFLFGSAAAGRMACHTCDNPPCVNPQHLVLGDHSSNAKDMYQRGRFPMDKKAKGNRHGLAKLTSDNVLEIRRRSKEGVVKLAKAFNVTKSTISHVCARRTWAHLP